MVLISKIDKKTWDNYVSNLGKTVIIPSKKYKKNLNENVSNTTEYKKKSTLANSNLPKKKGIKPDSILDLHGYTLYSGRLILNKYIINCYEKNIRCVLIITGKGSNNRGALKEEVPRWLDDKYLNKYLINFNQAPKQFGGEGALLVRIKNKYKNHN
tara:strand:+ start:44 stop:511 length:468 start_codon:yes stop_codon:yes gene_type:complete